MKRSQVDSILDKVHKRASAQAAIRSILPTRTPIKDVNSNGIDDDDEEEYVPVGVGGLIAASQKLLAINRGLDKTDARDALMFKRILTPDKLIGERVKLDAEGIRRAIMNRVSRSKSLAALHPFTFDGYTEKFIVGNPLSSPLEEINPLHLVEQSRRVTQMGPGGIGTDNAITENAQAIATDQFGFISPTEGPESERVGIDVRLAWGTKIGSDGKPYQKFFDRRAGKQRWMSPEDLDGMTIKVPD